MKVLALAAGVLAVVIGPTGIQTPVSGADVEAFRTAVRPQDDFYQFVNGAWLDATEVPPHLVAVSAATEVEERTRRDLLAIIESIVARPARRDGSGEQQVADMFASAMDEARLRELGLAPIQAELDRIEAIETREAFAAEVGTLASVGMGAPFDKILAPDPVDPSRLALVLRQGGILLPDRDYYLGRQIDAAVREGYEAYLTGLFELLGRPDPAGLASAVLAIEQALAAAHATADVNDPSRQPSRTSFRELGQRLPGFAWRAWARPQGIEVVGVVVLAQPSFFSEFAELAASTPLDDWKAWLTARYVTTAAPFLDGEIGRARFRFFGERLSGQTQPAPRWKRAVALIDEHLGDAIGRLYVQRHFPSASKAHVERIAREVVAAYRESIRSADWLSAATRSEALHQLASLQIRIGYPMRWRSYRGLVISADDLFGNVQRASKFAARAEAEGRHPADEGFWTIPPQSVTAYYDRAAHEIVVPAGLLQPPFFTPDADEAVNYGTVGAIVGHEIGHALDDLGRRFDVFGRLRDWWTPGDRIEVRRRAHALAGQFSAHAVLDIPVDAMTLNENLSDLGGLAVAHRAYRRSPAGRAAPVLDGLTGDQRFFIAWARIWREREREAFARQAQLLTPHTPATLRVNGTLSNLDAFVEAFDVREGDGLYRAPDDRVRIW